MLNVFRVHLEMLMVRWQGMLLERMVDRMDSLDRRETESLTLLDRNR